MGLDSVELVMAWEKYFEISISNIEAEKIRTVQNAVDCISSHFQFNENGFDVQKDVYNRLNSIFIDLNLITAAISNSEKIFDIIPLQDSILWKVISERVGYELPSPFLAGRIGILFEKVFPSKIAYESTTMERFVDLVCAVNYKRILGNGKVRSTYEVFIGVMGITIESQGINPFEIDVSKAFVDDLGIN